MQRVNRREIGETETTVESEMPLRTPTTPESEESACLRKEGAEPEAESGS